RPALQAPNSSAWPRRSAAPCLHRGSAPVPSKSPPPALPPLVAAQPALALSAAPPRCPAPRPPRRASSPKLQSPSPVASAVSPHWTCSDHSFAFVISPPQPGLQVPHTRLSRNCRRCPNPSCIIGQARLESAAP